MPYHSDLTRSNIREPHKPTWERTLELWLIREFLKNAFGRQDLSWGHLGFFKWNQFILFSLKTRKNREHRRFLALQSFILSSDLKKSNITIYITLIFVEEMLLTCFIRRGSGEHRLQGIAAEERKEIPQSHILFRIHCYIKRTGQHWRQLYPVLSGCTS